MVRFKNRYLFISISAENSIVFNLSRHALLEVLKMELLATYGISATVIMDSLQVKYFSNNHAMIRVSRDDAQQLLAAIVFITTIGKIKVRLDIQHVSGTIKKLEEFIIGYDRKQLFNLKKGDAKGAPLELEMDVDDE